MFVCSAILSILRCSNVMLGVEYIYTHTYIWVYFLLGLEVYIPMSLIR